MSTTLVALAPETFQILNAYRGYLEECSIPARVRMHHRIRQLIRYRWDVCTICPLCQCVLHAQV